MPNKRAIVIDILISELSAFDRPYIFLKKELNAEALREGTSFRIGKMMSPAFAKAWNDWASAFDRIEGIDEHLARLLILAFLAKLFEQVSDKDYKKRRVPPLRRILPFRLVANNKYAL